MDTTRRTLGAITAGAAAAALLSSRPAIAQSADEKTLAANLEAFREAYLKLDIAKLGALVADNLNYGHSSGTIENKQQFLDAAKARKGVMKTLKFSDVKTAVSGVSAVVRHIWESETELDGKTAGTKIGVLQVWQKGSDGNWRIYARQAYRLPT